MLLCFRASVIAIVWVGGRLVPLIDEISGLDLGKIRILVLTAVI
jgi:hypothetical protein